MNAQRDHQLLPDVFSAAYVLVESCTAIGARSVSVKFTTNGFNVVLCQLDTQSDPEPVIWSNLRSCWHRLGGLCHARTVTASTGHGDVEMADIEDMRHTLPKSTSVKFLVSGWQKMGM